MNPQTAVVHDETGESLDPRHVTEENYAVFDLKMTDDKLLRTVCSALDDDVDHWNKSPWALTETDRKTLQYFFGEQIDETKLMPYSTPYVDNRLFVTVRAILAYVTGQLAKPEFIPSKNEDKFLRLARNMEDGVYQHAQNNFINTKFRLAVRNLIMRKRGCLKLRFDPSCGPYGDILTENVDPSDIVIDRYAGFGQDPNRIWQRQKCTIDELCAKFPDKQRQIYNAFGFKRGVYTQLSRMTTYYECWFSYWEGGKKKQGLLWYLPTGQVVLGKMQNPNWLYKGSEKNQKIVNMTNEPIKPFVWLNYINTGRSFVDETSLFEQAMGQQDILNKRGRQITENADYAVPRLLVNGKVMSQQDADRFVNKNPKTIGLLSEMEPDANINNAVMPIPAQMLPAYVVNTLYDARNEIDTIMGTPNVFRGEQPQKLSNTLGQDVLIKQQAGALQDDLVTVVNEAMTTYYTYLLQMMKTYLPDDYFLLTKGTSGEYNSILLNSSNIDTNVRIGVRADSTLPLDKEDQRQMALELARLPGRIDDLSLYEMLGVPDPEKLAERVQRYNIDRYTYMQSIEQKLFNAEADEDIGLLTANKEPEIRDDYNEDYLNYFNMYIAKNRIGSPDSTVAPDVQQRLVDHLNKVANYAATTQALHDSMLNPAGILDRPPIFPMPKRDIRINLQGAMSPEQTGQIAGQAGDMGIPITQQQGDPTQQAPQPQPQQM